MAHRIEADRRRDAIRSTTVIAVRKGGSTALGADGQVTLRDQVLKSTASKIRRLYEDKILTGFAGGTADALTLFERLEAKLQSHNGNLKRAAVELAKDWRTDRHLRRLEALLIAADRDTILILSGNGDVIEPDEGIAAIGSGGGFATAAARAMADRDDLTARDVVERSLRIAASLCIYTNENIRIETL